MSDLKPLKILHVTVISNNSKTLHNCCDEKGGIANCSQYIITGENVLLKKTVFTYVLS